MEKFLDNEYRKLICDKSKQLIGKISTVIDIDKVVVLGSFTTKKERPADVDFIVMIKTKDSGEDWSTDIQFVPSTNLAKKLLLMLKSGWKKNMEKIIIKYLSLMFLILMVRWEFKNIT